MKTKKNILAILLTFFMLNGVEVCVAQTWQWAKHMGSIYGDFADDMCTDPSENVYLTGAFQSPKGVFGSDTLITNGQTDVFIVKLDSNGNFIWAKRAGGNGTMDYDAGMDIIYESSTNNLLMTGVMNSTGETIGNCNLGSGNKLFLSKLDLNGNCIWSVTQAVNDVNSLHITTDNHGNIYMNGIYNTTGQFNGHILQQGSFIAKFNSMNGACEWVKNISDTHINLGAMIYRNNNLYLGGCTYYPYNHNIHDTIHLDTAIVYCYNDDIFLTKWDTAGNVLWLKTIGGPNYDAGGNIGMDGNDNIYLSGNFKDTAYFGNTILTDGSNTDAFLAKYTNNGNLIWVKQVHSTSLANGYSVSTINNGNTYFTGVFTDTAHFGVYTTVATSPGDMFVARYDSSGVCMGVKTVGYAGPGAVITNSTGGCYVSGAFYPAANFDGNNLISYGNQDIFVAKLEAITGMDERMFSTNNTLIIYANPNKGTCSITVPDDLLNQPNLVLNIYDSSGKLIQQQHVQTDQEKIKINIEAEALGVYNVTLGNKTKMYSGKIIFE